MAKLKLDIDLPHGQPSLVLRGEDQVRKWAAVEETFWKNLAPAARSSIDPNLISIEVGLSALREIPHALDNKPDGWEEVVQNLASSATSSLQLLSRDPRASFLERLRELREQDAIIGNTLISFLDPQRLKDRLAHQLARGQTEVLVAVIYRALYFATGRTDDLTTTRQSLTTLQTETRTLLADQQAALRATEALRDSSAKAFDEFMALKAEEVAGTLRSFREEREKLDRHYKDELALRSPMDYWSRKATDHEEDATRYRNWFVGLLAVGGAAFVVLAFWLLIPELRTQAESVPLWPLLLFSLAVAAWAWPLRITSKLYLSHRHLHEDAAERETIARTFLALRDAVEVSPDDRKLLLGALFRPASAGLVKEEGGLSVTDLLLAKLLDR